nr:MAG TPA: hypothetical protein [Caudoviricetes sp.]
MSQPTKARHGATANHHGRPVSVLYRPPAEKTRRNFYERYHYSRKVPA